MMQEYSDRRQCKRRQINRVVSFHCPDGSVRVDWHFGRIQDVGSGGLRIKAHRSLILNPGQPLTILCLQEVENQAAGQEPARIQGRVVWLDSENQCFGLEYL